MKARDLQAILIAKDMPDRSARRTGSKVGNIYPEKDHCCANRIETELSGYVIGLER